MSDRLNSVKETLEAERSSLKEALNEARAKVGELETELERVEDALEALSGKKTKAKKRKSKGGGVTKEELRTYILEARSQNPALSGDPLKDRVKELARGSGKPLVGFGINYPKALEAAGS